MTKQEYTAEENAASISEAASIINRAMHGSYITLMDVTKAEMEYIHRAFNVMNDRIANLEAENANLKKQVEWHLFEMNNINTYPPRADMYLTLSIPERTEYRGIDDEETYDVLWFELYSEEYWHEHNVTHWAYLPAPPEEVSND